MFAVVILDITPTLTLREVFQPATLRRLTRVYVAQHEAILLYPDDRKDKLSHQHDVRLACVSCFADYDKSTSYQPVSVHHIR